MTSPYSPNTSCGGFVVKWRLLLRKQGPQHQLLRNSPEAESRPQHRPLQLHRRAHSHGWRRTCLHPESSQQRLSIPLQGPPGKVAAPRT